jgi:Holliday junction resolvase RusA-like endonuclease
MEIRINVPMTPVAQPRVRFSLGGHAYTPRTVGKGAKRKQHPIHAFKKAIMDAAREAYTGPPLDGPLKVDITFVFPRQANKIWKTRPMPRYRHVGKPDRDNLDKAVLDSLVNIGLMVDDCQVCSGTIEKWRAAGDEQPYCEAVITELE